MFPRPPASTLFPYTTLFRSATGSRPRHGRAFGPGAEACRRSEEHTSELQSLTNLVCRLLLEKKKDAGAAGLKLHPRAENFTLDHPALVDVVALAHERRRPIV